MTWIDIPTPSGLMPAYLRRAAQGSPERAPIVLVHEAFGLNSHIASIADRLAALGRTSAKARVAAILLEIRNRMQLLDRSTPGSFILGLTQEEIGDATGLTAVHVNRMLRQLEEEKIISREAGRIRFLDEPRMARAANYVDRYAGLNLGWLPGHP